MSWTWWMTVLVILAVLVLIGCIPVGVDAAYGEGGVLLSAKIGFFRPGGRRPALWAGMGRSRRADARARPAVCDKKA